MVWVESFVRSGEDIFASTSDTLSRFIPHLDQRFLLPGALILLLFLIPLIILYLIRPKPQERTISSLMFLIKDTGKSIIKQFFRTFTRDPLFFFHLFILLFLILAATHPYITLSETTVDKPTVIIIDASGSMQAQNRFGEAKNLAKDFLALRNTVIYATNSPDAVAIDLSKRKSATIIDSLQPSDTETDLYDAILLAPSYLKEPGRVIVISDFADVPAYLNAKRYLETQGHTVYLKKVGSQANNIGIVDADIKEKKTSIVIKNFNDKEETVRVKVNTELIDTKTIPPLSTDISTFTTPPGVSTIALDIEDDYPLDNTLYVSAPEKHAVSVLIITNEPNIQSYDFITALDAITSNSTTTVTYTITNPPKVPSINQDIVIFKNVNKELLLPGTIDDTIKQVKRGRAAIIMIQDDLFSMNFKDLLPYTYVSKETEGLIEKSESGFSITDNVDFGTVGTYLVLKPGEGVLPLASVGDSPIVAFKSIERGKTMYYGIFDESADFPKEPYYPIFWKRTIDFLSGKPDILDLNHKTGTIVALQDAKDITTPSGKIRTASLFLGKVGHYELPDMTIAANLLSPYESNLNADTAQEQLPEDTFTTQPHKEPFDFSRYFIIASLVLLTCELLFLKFRGDL
jgi:hypothetical protein